MAEERVIEMIPSKIKEILNYIDNFIFTKGNNSSVFKFFSVTVDNEQICALEISDDVSTSVIKLGIPIMFDYLFYQQLLISILDNYCGKYNIYLSKIYDRIDAYIYSFHILLAQHGGINIIIETRHDLSKLIEYYNEKISIYRNKCDGGSKK